MTCSVLVCDDNPEFAAACVERIRGMAPPEYVCHDAPSPDTLRHAVIELLRRNKSVLTGSRYERRQCVFDTADILIIDYDLIHVDDDNARHTGEGIGRLARIYSNCAVVVVFNQFNQFDFDLSLRAHLASHADLNLSIDVIATPGLWKEPPWTGFRPWYWPVLSKAVASQRAREEVLGRDLSRPIVHTLDIRDCNAMGLSDSAFGFLAPKAVYFDELREMTLDSFISMTADVRETATLLSSDRSAAIRFGAARIGKWLERAVIGPQDVLVDVPHLLQRFPFLLGRYVSDVDAWNEAIYRPDVLRKEFDESYWFRERHCLSRPAVWCRRLEADKDFDRRRATFDYSEVPDIVFMEDASVFDYFSHGREFRSGFHNSYDRRLVRLFPDVRYGPQRRFAFTFEE